MRTVGLAANPRARSSTPAIVSVTTTETIDGSPSAAAASGAKTPCVAATWTAFAPRVRWNADRTVILRSPVGPFDGAVLSDEGRAVARLLTAGPDDVEPALRALPPALRAKLAALSPLTHIARVRAPLILLLHDRDDHLIPVTESRRLWAALEGRPSTGSTYPPTAGPGTPWPPRGRPG